MHVHYDDAMTVRAAREKYFGDNGFGDGGYEDRWVRFKVGPYSTGLEWMQSWVDYRSGGGEEERTGSMVLYSVRFDF